MRILCCCAVVGVLTIIGSSVDAQDARPVSINCTWSTTLSELKAAMPPGPTGSKTADPKKKKGSIDRPESNVKRSIAGPWIVELVIDEKGDVRDAKVIRGPIIQPPWPEYEVAILKSVRSWKYSPLRMGNQGWPHCATITIRDRE